MLATQTARPSFLSRLAGAFVAGSLLALVLIPGKGAAIPPAERTALIDLYNNTGGASWTNNSGWVTQTPGTECSWFGVCCWNGANCTGGTNVTTVALNGNNLVGTLPSTIGNLTALQYLRLTSNTLSGTLPTSISSLSSLIEFEAAGNQLSGAIPPEIGGKPSLQLLVLSGNQFSGPIPSQIWGLTSLQVLALAANQLTGPIDPGVGNLTSLQQLYLRYNFLSGQIPTQIGNLTNLQFCSLDGNNLVAPIPSSMTNMTALVAGGSDFSYNALDTTDGSLITFLNSKQNGGDWQSTQTIPPTGLATSGPTDTTINLTWTAIPFNGSFGYYEVHMGTTPGGPYSYLGQTSDKVTTGLVVSGLNPVTTYYFVVRTVTLPLGPPFNPGTVTSNFSTEVSGTTLASCSYVLIPSSSSPPASGATSLTFQVSTSPGCSWLAQTNDTWITITGGASGVGTGIVTYDVAANAGPVRGGLITAGGQPFSVNQADGCAANSSFVPTSTSIGASGSTGLSFSLQTSALCSWELVPSDPWITVTSGLTGIGPTSVLFDVASNSGPGRVGTITALGQTFTVNQADGCAANTSLVPSSSNPPSAGATGLTFQIVTPASCPWTVISNDAWVTITSASSGIGPTTVTYDVAANVGPARVGTISAAAQTFTVNQAGGCSGSLNPTSSNPPPAGAIGQTFQVLIGGGCPWTAVSNDAWITITGGLSGSGNGTVTYDVASNGGPARVGTITAAGQTFTVNQGIGCSASLNPTSANPPFSGATGQTFQVLIGGGCPWTATSNAAWITLTGGLSGSGNGTVTYDVAANSGPARSGTITAGGQTFTVNQADGCAANTVLNPTSSNPPAGGAAGLTFQVQTTAGCGWTAVSNAPWITITAGSSGTGTGTVTYDVAANASPARVGTITAGGQTFTVNQAGGCSGALLPSSVSVPATSSTGQGFQVQIGAGCPWSATSNAAWLTITGGTPGTGPGSVTFNVAANPGPARVGTITAAGQTFTVNQADGCTSSTTLIPTSASQPVAGASGQTFQVNTIAGCSWTSVPNVPWLTITAGSSGVGTGTVTYSVGANPGLARFGTITAGGQTFTVNQADGCSANTSLNPTSASQPASGATGQAFQVQTTAGCPWTAAANVPWITITAGSSGTGTGPVTYSVAANPGPARSGTVTAGGQTFTVNQLDDCNGSTVLTPSSASIPAAGTAGQVFQVQTLSACPWTATSNAAWITLTAGSSGIGTANVTYTVSSNPGPARTGTVTVSGKTFTVNQADNCTGGTVLSPTGTTAPAGGATAQNFQVQTLSGCPWTASSNSAWITITSGASGTGTGNVAFDVASNSGPARTGSITAAGKTFTVDQGDGCAGSAALTPPSRTAPAAGLSGQTLTVQISTGCPWLASSSDSWITLTSAPSGTGTTDLRYDVARNTGPFRSGRIVAAGLTHVVNQQDGCVESTILDPASAALPASASGELSFQVIAPDTCSWTATSNSSWITLVSGTSGTGGGRVAYRALANTGPQRSGSITAGGRTFTVTQADACTEATSLEPASTTVPVAGATGLSFQVVAGAGCPWSATSNDAWLTITSGASGAGNGVVTFNVAPNSGPDRSGTITAAGKTFTVRQVPGCFNPSTAVLTSFPSAPVVAGNSFTVAWSPVLDLPSTGYYRVLVSSNGSCTSPASSITTDLSVTVPTEAGKQATYCVQVQAVAGGACPPENASALSDPALIQVRPLAASFTVIQGQAPPARVVRNSPPPTGSMVVFRNVGETAGVLTLSATGGFFAVARQTVVEVAPGADLEVGLLFFADSTLTAGAKSGELTGSWSAGGTTRTVSTPVTLTVLEAQSQSTRGVKLEPVDSSLVTFSQSGGNPPPQQVRVRNTGTVPVRIAPAIGPGSWLSISGDFASLLPGGGERSFDLSVDRSRRTTEDGAPPISTLLRIDNVDGNPEDAAVWNVFDEEPPPPGSGTNRADLDDQEFSLILGSVVSTTKTLPRRPGIDGTSSSTQYLSDGWIRNRGSDWATINLYYTPEGAQGITDPRVKKSTVILGGYASYRLSDFVRSLFRETGSGLVELRSRQLPQLSVRQLVDTVTTRDGLVTTFGAELPLLVSGQGVSTQYSAGIDQFILLPGLKGSLTGHRSNIIFSETLGRSIEVVAKLFAANGRKLGEKRVFVNPYSKTQINSGDPALFPAPYSDASLEVTPVGGEGAVSVLATVLDNTSQSCVVRLGTVYSKSKAATRKPNATSTGFQPTVSREKSADSFYTTRLSITNGSETDVSVTVTFIPDQGYGAPSEPKAVVIPKRETADGQDGPKALAYEDVLKDLLGIDATTRGMLKFEGNLAPLVFATETSTLLDPANPDSGRSLSSINPAPGADPAFPGVFSAASPEIVGLKQSDSDAAKAEVSLPAIEENAQFRTNLILAEFGGEKGKVRILLRKPGGAALGDPVIVELGANERKQLDRIILTVAKPPSGAADFKDIEIVVQAVEGKSKTLALVSKVATDPKSKRIDTYVLGPAVSSSAKKGKK